MRSRQYHSHPLSTHGEISTLDRTLSMLPLQHAMNPLLMCPHYYLVSPWLTYSRLAQKINLKYKCQIELLQPFIQLMFNGVPYENFNSVRPSRRGIPEFSVQYLAQNTGNIPESHSCNITQMRTSSSVILNTGILSSLFLFSPFVSIR